MTNPAHTILDAARDGADVPPDVIVTALTATGDLPGLCGRLDLRDPHSIARWYRRHPARHGPQLAAMKRLWPQFGPAIEAAGRMLRAADDAGLRATLDTP